MDPLYRPQARSGDRLPALFLFTDPQRLPDPLAAAARLPRGSGVVFRGFGAADAAEAAAGLVRLARARGLTLLVGADPDLAAAVGAHGVHLPERSLQMARRLRRARPDWLLTGAVHSPRSLAGAERLELDGVFLSPVFASASASAAGVCPFGAVRFSALARRAGTPVFGLGGIDPGNAGRLAGAWGVAAVEALSTPRRCWNLVPDMPTPPDRGASGGVGRREGARRLSVVRRGT